jgi:hypothetical protein
MIKDPYDRDWLVGVVKDYAAKKVSLKRLKWAIEMYGEGEFAKGLSECANNIGDSLRKDGWTL